MLCGILDVIKVELFRGVAYDVSTYLPQKYTFDHFRPYMTSGFGKVKILHLSEQTSSSSGFRP